MVETNRFKATPYFFGGVDLPFSFLSWGDRAG